MVDATAADITERQARRAPDPRAQGAWGRLKAYGLWPVLLLLVGATALYVYAVRLPYALSFQQHYTAIIPGWEAFNKSVLVVHILTALPPLVLGWIGFSKRMRKRSLEFHRWVGTFYCYGIWISAVTGFALGSQHDNGWGTRAGYCALATAWFVTTWIAYRRARQRNIPAHRQWMIRSYAVTLAVITVRPITFVPTYFEVDPVMFALVMSWACWLPNVVLAEVYVRSTDFRGRLLRWQAA